MRIAIAMLACAGLVAAQPLAAQEPIELKLSFFLPTSHGFYTDWLKPWGDELERRTDGRVTVEYFPAGSTFGNPAAQYDQVVAGVTDLAVGLRSLPAGRFLRTSLIEMPFLVSDAGVGTRILWELFPTYLEEEYPGVKVLALHTHNPGLIITKDQPIRVVEDMEGLRLRTVSPIISAMLAALGAEPVGLPPLAVYENLEKGVIDGAAFTWDAVNAFRLAEVIDYAFEVDAYVLAFYFVMNQASYDNLPDDVRAVLDDMTGDALVDKFDAWWDQWDAPGIAAAEAEGVEVTIASLEQRALWQIAVQPVVEAYLHELEDQGVENAREIYAEMQRLASEYE